LAQLKKLDSFNQKRRENAKYLSAHLHGVTTPYIPDGSEHVFHQYTIRVAGGKRDGLMTHLQENGVGCGVYYPVPIHQQTYYMNDLGYNQSLPVAENAAGEVLSLPIHPDLSRADLDIIVTAVNGYMLEE
jgi:dTDP-4-amino-4,6-dideoxygalactose transaminase